jgi:hypothetical protein
MPEVDEPLLDGGAGERPADEAPGTRTGERIRRLAESQLYGVLCTQGEGQPYGSMVAFAFTPDLGHAVFATPKATRKYTLLRQCQNVALVVNNQTEFPRDMMKIEAFTATGRVREITDPELLISPAQRLRDRHPHLAGFIAAPSTALFVIDIVRFFHVHAFQEVRQWVPSGAPGASS